MRREKPRLGELLERRGVITREQLLRALRNQKVVGGKLGTCLLEIDAVPEEALLQALAEQQDGSAAGADDLRGVPDVVLQLVPSKVARRLAAVPFKASGTQARIAVLDCNDLAALDELSFVTGRRVHLHVTSEARLFEALERYYGEPCSQRIAKLVERLNRSRYLWRADAPVETSSRDDAGSDSRPTPSAFSTDEFIPKFQRSEGLELPPMDLPMALQPTKAPTRAHLPPAGPAPEPEPAPGPIRETAPAPPTVTPLVADGPPILAQATPAPTAPRAEPPPAPVPAEPADLESIEARLQNPLDRDDVGRSLLEFADSRGRRVMLFKVVRDGIAGWMSGPGIDKDRLLAFRVSRNEPSLFRSLLEGAPLHRGPLSELKADEELRTLRAVDSAATDVLLLPILVRDRIVAILYLEPSGEVFTPQTVSDLQRVAAKAAIALELCVLRGKLARA